MTDIPKRDDQHRDPLRAAVAGVIQAADNPEDNA